jgi:hypothetical protein
MGYTSLYNELKLLYDPSKPEIELPSRIHIKNFEFQSDCPANGFVNPEDPFIKENSSFSYPVFCPREKSNRVILLLHGLNERSWAKYLVWAHRLTESTSSYVILFPISFHINRSPESWSNPRFMSDFLKTRNSVIGKISNASFANIALSNRLTDDPMRFFNSGYQTVNDIVKLLNSVKNGSHPEITPGSRVNVFGYSIGAFLSEIMVMGNPDDLFSESRLFIFCGGSVFSNMNGSSKLIMDKRAFDRVYEYYLKYFETDVIKKNRLSEFLQTSKIGLAFRSMIDLGRLVAFRENLFSQLNNQLQVIALEKDSVIPMKGIIDTLKATGRKDSVTRMDFRFPYSHENPFPVLGDELFKEVDICFERVFDRATAFLA